MAAGITLRVLGVGKVVAAAKRLAEQYEKALDAGVYGLGNEIMTDSKRRVPVDFGALKGSGYVTLPQRGAGGSTVEIGFGGPAKAYAIVQHERTEFKHEVGEAKFLENAVNAAVGNAPRRVAEIAAAAFKAGAGPGRGGNPQNPDSGQRGGGSGGSG